MTEMYSLEGEDTNGKLIMKPVSIEERVGSSWDRYRCQNKKCNHYDMSHDSVSVFGPGKCLIKGCECKDFEYGDNYD